MRKFAIGLVIVAGLGGCALLPAAWQNDARKSAALTLVTYETAQQSLLIYGKLEKCEAPETKTKICRSQKLWNRIKAVEKAATLAIMDAEPVLNGDKVDAGEVFIATTKIGELLAAYKDAQLALGVGDKK